MNNLYKLKYSILTPNYKDKPLTFASVKSHAEMTCNETSEKLASYGVSSSLINEGDAYTGIRINITNDICIDLLVNLNGTSPSGILYARLHHITSGMMSELIPSANNIIGTISTIDGSFINSYGFPLDLTIFDDGCIFTSDYETYDIGCIIGINQITNTETAMIRCMNSSGVYKTTSYYGSTPSVGYINYPSITSTEKVAIFPVNSPQFNCFSKAKLLRVSGITYPTNKIVTIAGVQYRHSSMFNVIYPI